MRLQVGHDKRFEALGCGAHANGVCLHDLQVGSHIGREVGLVDDEKVALGDARSALARDFFTCGNIDDINCEVAQFRAESGGQVVAARLDKYNVCIREVHQHAVDRFQVDGSVFPDGGMRAATGFDAHDALGVERATDGEDSLVFLGVDVVGNRHQVVLVLHRFAQHFKQCGFA